MRIPAISGSLRARSSNTAIHEAAAVLAPREVQIEIYEGLSGLPYFNPDQETDSPPTKVAEARDRVASSRGLLLCSPEYARGVAGMMKNALDRWVGSTAFPGKAVALIDGSQRATHSDEHLGLALSTMAATLIEGASITLPLLGRNLDADGIVADVDLSARLAAALQALVRAIDARGEDRCAG